MDTAATSHSACSIGTLNSDGTLCIAEDEMAGRYHDPEATVEEGIATLKRCIDEVSKRLVVAPSNYKVRLVDKDGVREIEI